MTALPDELYERIVALLRTLVSSCKCCCRPKSACYDCDLHLVQYLMQRLDSERNQLRMSDRDMRFDSIIGEIRKAGRPLLAREIDTSKRLCARGLKHWTLRRMVKLGLLKIAGGSDKRTRYDIGDNAK